MGGNALSFETRRIGVDEYNTIVEEIAEILYCQGVYLFADVPFYHKKDSFGDIDFILVAPDDDRSWVKPAFNPKEIYCNSDIYSFDYKDVQIDLIFVKPENFAISLYYFAYNDLGNLIGRIFHKMGLKFGHDGLTFVVRDDTQVIGEISLSKNIDDILVFGGYDPVRYHKGFDDLQSIFEFVVSSKFYSYDIFDLDNRNYRARVRDRKRKTYTEFLKWAEANASDTKYRWASNKADYIPSILHHFGKIDEYFAIIRKHSRHLSIKEKFNGDVVSRLTDLSGKELGAFMSAFRKVFTDRDLEMMSSLSIESEIVNFSRGFDL